MYLYNNVIIYHFWEFMEQNVGINVFYLGVNYTYTTVYT